MNVEPELVQHSPPMQSNEDETLAEILLRGANGSKPVVVSDLERICHHAAQFIDKMTENHLRQSQATQENLLRVGRLQSEWDGLMREVQSSLAQKSAELREHVEAALAEMRDATAKIVKPQAHNTEN